MSYKRLYTRLRELFTYQDGVLIRRSNQSSNARQGDIAGWLDGDYYKVKVDRKQYLLHRLIYLYHHQKLPKLIDHVDGNTLNNTIGNLREANRANNRHNSNKTSAKSGYKGVYKDGKKWKGLSHCGGRRHYLGMFNTPLEAAIAVDSKNKELHGDFYKSILEEQ